MMSRIFYEDETLELIDDFIDVGYMAENIEVKDMTGNSFEIKRSHGDGSMTLLVSLPDVLFDEIFVLDEFLSAVQVPIHCYLVLAQSSKKVFEAAKKFQKFKVVFDIEEEFGRMYGTKIVKGNIAPDLCKSLFLISKDGAIFYVDMPINIEKHFDLEQLASELNKAYAIYNGVGCHG